MERVQKIPKLRIRYVEENCTHCKLCVDECPTGALEIDCETQRVVFDQYYLCIECCACVQICRSHAMVLVDPWEFVQTPQNK